MAGSRRGADTCAMPLRGSKLGFAAPVNPASNFTLPELFPDNQTVAARIPLVPCAVPENSVGDERSFSGDAPRVENLQSIARPFGPSRIRIGWSKDHATRGLYLIQKKRFVQSHRIRRGSRWHVQVVRGNQ